MRNDVSKIIFDGRTVIHDDLAFTDEDRQFAKQLTLKQIIEIDELKQGIRFTAKWSWAGVVQFHNFELQIKPKLSAIDHEADNLALAELLEFVSDTHNVKMLRRPHNFDAVGLNLLELIVASFANACEEIVSRGILADYVDVEKELPVLRGTLLVMKQLQKRAGRFDLLECLHDEQSTDICENKLLLAALLECAKCVKGDKLKAQIMRLTAIFEDLADVTECAFDFEGAYKELRSAGYNRLNSYYRPSHELADLIMTGIGVRNVFARGERQCFAFLFKMSEVFEKFVSKILLLQLDAAVYKIHSQREESRILWNDVTDTSYATLRPDLLIQNKAQTDVFLPVDAKFKNYDVWQAYRSGDDIELSPNAVDEFAKKVSTTDIFQTFTYAQGFAGGENAASPTAMIIYSSSLSEAAIRRINVRHWADNSAKGTIIVVPLNVKNELAALKTGKNTKAMNEVVEIICAVLGVAPAQ